MSRYIDADALREKVLYHADTMNHAGNHEQAKAFNYCLCMIDDMPTADVPQWIPCSEWLPKENGRYLVTFAESSFYNPVCQLRFENGKFSFSHFFATEEELLAWMPLPEPWKREAE